MTRDKLLTVNKWNKRKFAFGGDTNWTSGLTTGNSYDGIGNFANSTTNNFMQNGSSQLSSMAPAIKQTPIKKGFNWKSAGQAGQAAAGAFLNTEEGDKLLDELDPMYHIAGGRESGVGNAFDTAGKGLFTTGVSTGNPWLMLAGAGAKVIGGGINTLFGKKLNKENINDVENFITNQRTAGKELSGAQTSDALVSGWGDVDQGYTFNRNYIGKDGVFNHGATAKTNKLWGEQKDAQNYLTHSFMQGLGNVDKMDNRRVMTNFTSNAAFGGPLDVIGNNDNMGAIGYGFMSDYMNMRNNQVQGKGKIGANYFTPTVYAGGGSIHIDPKNRGKFTETMRRTGKSAEELSHSSNPLTRRRAIFALNARKWKHKHDDGGILDNMIGNNDTLFAFGGDLQTNSSDFGTGLTHIDNGGSHEENPYEGVQYGIASDGEPNLVEEGETVFNDYVFSNRIKPKKSVLRQFHIHGNGGKLTYADVSKKLEKESQERPNDPKSQAALKEMLGKLADAQEQQKAEEEARKARKAFEALSPEEQAAVMQQLAQQQQAAQQEEAPQEEVPVDENGNPVEQQPQEMMQGAPEEGQPQEALMGAFGGRLGHRFDDGGLKEGLYRSLGFNVDSDWDKWYKDNKLVGDIDLNNYTLKELLANKGLMAAIKSKSPALYDALNRGYDFGMYKYNPKDNTVRDINNGTWANAKQGAKSWRTSQDPIWSEAVDLYMNDNNLKDRNAAMDAMEKLQQKDFENLLMRTNSYQKTNEALHDDANSLAYLNAVLKSDASDAAKNYARNFVDEATGQWKKDVKHSFEDVYGSDGKGVRFTDPGSYWHTYLPAIRKNNVTNLLVNDDGSVEQIYGDVPKDFISAGNPFTFNTEDAGNTLNYYKRKAVEEAKKADDNIGDLPKLKYTKNPYATAGLATLLAGAGLRAAGYGKPDFTDLRSNMSYLNNGNFSADYQPIGGYLRYTPYDSQNAINKANATALGLNRGLMNSNSPISTRNAALLANGLNMQNNQGELGIKGRQYNDVLRQQVASFNRETDKANADAYNRVALANAEQRLKRAQLQASLGLDISKAQLDADAAWKNGAYQQLSAMNNYFSKKDKEARMFNMARAYINSGAAGAATPELAMMLNTTRTASKGGKLKKRKRGLTY